jgi:hypothetical protein
MKDRNFNNMAGDPYLWENCCGGAAMLAADGSVDPAPKPGKMQTIVTIGLMVAFAGVAVFVLKKVL